MANVPLTYVPVCEQKSIRSHTLMPYAVEWLHFKAAISIRLIIRIRKQRPE